MRGAWRFITDHYLLIPVGGALALFWANTYADSYFRLAHASALLVNDVGMALVLAYLAQEIVEAALPGGALHPFRRLVVPVIAGVGGTIGASLVYLGYLALGDEQILAHGWTIPGAADLVVALAVARAIFGRSAAVTAVLVIALMSDVIALIIIAPQHPVTRAHPAAAVLIAVAIAVAAILRLLGVASSWPYVAVAGLLSWLGFYWAGLAPALALLPIVPFLRHSPRTLTSFGESPLEHSSRTHFESTFAVPVQLIAMLFAFVNIGIGLRGYGTGTWAVMTASLVGRPVGTLAAFWMASLVGLRLPRSMGWKDAVVSSLAAAPTLAFGVLVSLSVFPVGPLLVEAKLGAILTVVGLVLPFGAARLLHVGRFAATSSRAGQRGEPTRIPR